MVRRPTIVDVAREAGVSKSTVSLVLQQSPLVRSETRAAVERAMASLGYVYNRTAATLRGRGRDLVGLVINDLRNPFFTEFAASAQMAFARRGYATVIANTDEDVAMQERVVASMIEHGVTAFLISPAYGGDGSTFERILRAGIPAMQVLRRLDERTALFPFAAPDYASGGRLAADHLVGLGARRVAFVGGLADRPVTQERMAGVVAALEAASIGCTRHHGRPARAFGREAAAELAGVDAVVCFNDLVALGMLAGYAERGVCVGRDVRLVGFDDIEECALAFPQLSSVRCDIARFGERAAETMLAWIEEGVRPPEVHRAPVALAARASTLGVPARVRA
jgi:LacI family transcriptional regulator